MTRSLAAAALILCLAAPALAQLRTLPAHAKSGKIRHVQEMVVLIDGKQAVLARGAQVRDAHNRILVPTAIPADSLVKYTLNPQGEMAAVWILTPEEAAAVAKSAPLPKPAPAK